MATSTKPTTVTEAWRGKEYTAELILEDEGKLKRVGRRKDREARVGRVFRVEMGGEVIGRVSYEMITRERRTPGRTYVNARWESPGWVYRPGPETFARRFECFSRKDGAQRLIRDAAESGSTPHAKENG